MQDRIRKQVGESITPLIKSNPEADPPLCGAIAQLGERIVRNDEVVGSIPTSSTIPILPPDSPVEELSQD